MHKKTVNKKYLCFTVLILIYCVCFIVQTLHLKKLYPDPPVNLVAYESTFSTEGYQIALANWNIQNYSDTVKQWPVLESAYQDMGAWSNPDYIIYTDLIITNTSAAADTYLDITRFNFESGSWSNGISLDGFQLLNPGYRLSNVQVPAGEQLTLHLTCNIYRMHFSDSLWKNIRNRSFGLTLTYYPQKILLTGEKIKL
ncbi:MAG: hypothetical protein PHG16_10545 [Lachnospiraceae bacterium]|nr:hypothetical protein [Lachnospiraceae bacterium]